MKTKKVKFWKDLSEQAQMTFITYADWMNHFGMDVIEEAQDYYALSLDADEYGQGRAVTAAWHYAQGASRFMQKP
jgi:hypothetical protein